MNIEKWITDAWNYIPMQIKIIFLIAIILAACGLIYKIVKK